MPMTPPLTCSSPFPFTREVKEVVKHKDSRSLPEFAEVVIFIFTEEITIHHTPNPFSDDEGNVWISDNVWKPDSLTTGHFSKMPKSGRPDFGHPL